MELRKLLNQLPEPKNEIELISYQTLLPYYSPEIINEYNAISPGMGDSIVEMLQKDINHLTESKKKYEMLQKVGFNILFKSTTSWKKHIAKCGWNVSGKYLG